MDEIASVREWVSPLATALGVAPPDDETVVAILALTRLVAHGSQRRNGPVAAFLAGCAAGDARRPEALGVALEAVRRQTPPPA